MRREYSLRLKINGRPIDRVLIDSHYEIRHFRVMNDALILELVKSLNGRSFEFVSTTAEGWEIYVNDPLYLGQKPYRMVWCLHAEEDYVGVINAFRRPNAKIPH